MPVEYCVPESMKRTIEYLKDTGHEFQNGYDEEVDKNYIETTVHLGMESGIGMNCFPADQQPEYVKFRVYVYPDGSQPNGKDYVYAVSLPEDEPVNQPLPIPNAELEALYQSY